ncbi:hypothetical protein EGW08_000820, partial [Elysia chlorotica]
LEKPLERDLWHAIKIQRTGLYLNVSVQQQGQAEQSKSTRVDVERLGSLKSEPVVAYIGGAPAEIQSGSASWEGCVAGLRVNAGALNLFTPDSAGRGASLCDNHCAARAEPTSAIFNGNGFLHYSGQLGDSTTSVEFAFTTRQQSASLLSVVNNTQRFCLHVMLEGGALKVQSSSDQKSVLYLSSNNIYGDGQTHMVKIEFKESATHITVDGTKDAFQVRSSRPVVERRSLQGVSIGAFVSIDRQLQQDVSRPLIGCISDVSVNGEKLPLSQADEMYNVYQGYCADAQENVWHACRRWTENSSSVVLGNIPLSRAVSLWVSSDAKGPVLRYTRHKSGADSSNDFTVDIVLESDELTVTINDSPTKLKRPAGQGSGDFFSVLLLDKPSVSTVEVYVWGQKVELVYLRNWLWLAQASDADQPHSLVLAGLDPSGQQTGHEAQRFTGSLSRLVIEDRYRDLSLFTASHNITSCQRQLSGAQLTDVNS